MREPFLLNFEELHRFCPSGKRGILLAISACSPMLEDYGLTVNELRLCHFLAQAAHETDGFQTLVEYGRPSYFRRRYGHRRDLGNQRASDGPLFRGRGIFQLTGRYNYRRYGHYLDVDLEARPQLAKEPGLSLRIACEYWKRHKLNHLADKNDIRAITRHINGGHNGLRDRQRYFQRAMSVWSPVSLQDKGVLRVGDRGGGVKCLQKRLAALGYTVSIDGLFGRQTQRALKTFQKTSKLVPDGLFGPLSQKKLREYPPPIQRRKNMDQWKSYLLSRTIWANIIGLVALTLDVFGFNGIGAKDQSQLVDQLLNLMEAGGFIASVVFRAIARDRLGPTLF